MITTGIIKAINRDGGNHKNNKYLVELNIFQIPGDLNISHYEYEANCSAIPGQYAAYNVGDKVYVSFLNQDYSLPIILGKIYQGNTEESCSYLNIQSLQITNNAKLPSDTEIGDISCDELIKLLKQKVKKYYKHCIKFQTDNSQINVVSAFITSDQDAYPSQELTSDSAIFNQLYSLLRYISEHCDFLDVTTNSRINSGAIISDIINESRQISAIDGTDKYKLIAIIEDIVIEI